MFAFTFASSVEERKRNERDFKFPDVEERQKT